MREHSRVDSLVVLLKERMNQVESLLMDNVPEAEQLFQNTLDEFYEIEYMNKYLLFGLFDNYQDEGNVAACEMIGEEGILRYPDEDRFYSRLGNLHFKEGDFEKALKVYSCLLKLNPNNISLRKKIEEINKDIKEM